MLHTSNIVVHRLLKIYGIMLPVSVILSLALLGSVFAYTENGPTFSKSQLVGEQEPQPRQNSCECGRRRSSSDERIVGGTQAQKNEFPWRAGLFMITPRGYSYFCSAAVISDDWILTAAHCARGAEDNGYDIAVNLGEHDMSTASETRNQLINASNVIVHPEYNDKTFDNDMALIKLERPYTPASNIGPLCLPYGYEDESFSGTKVWASGWGATNEGNRTTPMILRKVELPVLSTEECRRYFSSGVITDNMICTYRRGKDTCQGDSGGSIDFLNPNSGKYMALGVVSWGYGCARRNNPGVYAKVPEYLDWIEQTTGETFCSSD